jgi:tetratricopeptide (TPR) repeat protein
MFYFSGRKEHFDYDEQGTQIINDTPNFSSSNHLLMKWSTILLLSLSAFLTAAAVRFIVQKPQSSKTEMEKIISVRKKTGFGCSPAYIPNADESIPPLTGWGNYRWKITTGFDSAQFYFNQGMAMYYAFHIIESRASFDKATRFDPSCAMAWWGKALAFGPNINDFGYQRPSEAYPSAMKAVSLKASGTAIEKSLIDAIAIRYTDDSTRDQKVLNEQYKDAMGKVYKGYNNNADITALYADALMLLHPWDLYNHDYSAKAWTPQIVTTLKHALKLAPAHPGANHYFIHAVEASANPGDALKSAKFLATAMPSVSHVTHMPSHIYIRTGYYNSGINVNDHAVEGYKKYLSAFAPTAENVALYSLHNLHMKIACAQMAGNYKQALLASKKLQEEIPGFYLSIEGALGHYIQYLHQSELMTNIRFGKWEEILNEQVVDSLPYTSVLQHFGRGIAFARTNRLTEAAAELAQMKLQMQNASLKEPFTPFNSAYNGGLVAQGILEGVIAAEQSNSTLAIKHFEEAVKEEDALIYNEPRDWLLPARHYLGDALLKAGRYTEAIVVLKEDLKVNPSNGWAITGLQMVFEKLSRSNDIIAAKQRLKNAWLVKDVEIKSPVF